jgi:effector-binding domain-containing protein
MLAVTQTGMAGIGISIPQVIEREAAPYAAIAVSGPMVSLPSFAPLKFEALHGWMGEHGIKHASPGFFRYRKFDAAGNVTVEVGAPVPAGTAGSGEVIADVLPAGRYAAATYTGPYDRLYDAFLMLNGWMRGRGLEPDGTQDGFGEQPACQLEIYHVTPMNENDPARLVTEILIKLAGPNEEKTQ